MKKILSLITSIIVFSFILVGCSKKDVVITDREGNKVTMSNKLERIISTAPANTETLVELGLADKLVAVDKYSSDVAGIPDKIEKIDFTNPDAETIISLNPD